MNLLNKFTTVEVDNTQRIPQDLKDQLDQVYIDYQNAMKHNLIYLETLNKLPSGKSTKSVRFDTYYTDNKDMLNECKTRIRNLKDSVLVTCLNIFNRKYNLTLKNKDFIISGKSASSLYSHKHYDLWRHGSESLTWEEIENFDPNIDSIIDFVFDKVGFANLDDVLKNESTTYLMDMYSDSSHRDDIHVAKNGVMTFSGFLVNPTSSHTTDTNKRALISLTTMMELWLQTQGSTLDDVFEVNKLIKYFEIGTYYSSYNDTTKMYDTLESDGIFEYMKHFQNGKFKIKVKNYATAHSFLSFCGLIK